MPKVSIIVPAYNAEKVIGRCVESILNQEYKDIECIVVNDGSKDNTLKVLQGYQLNDERLIVIDKPNSGVSSTRNKALSVATGEYVQFLDADDWIPENSTKELVRAMEENKADLVVGDFYRVVGENVSIKGSIITNNVLTRKEYAEYMMETPADYYYGVIWNKLYRRSIIEEHQIRMDESLSFCEDFVFNLEYDLHIERIVPLQVPVYYYVKTDGSLVSQNINVAKIYHMKTNIFTYYNDFFKNILDEHEYREERVNIVRFLFAAAHDDMVLPMMPGTKKLGKEKVAALTEELNRTNLVTAQYFISRAYDRLLETVAYRHELELADVKVFDALRQSEQLNTVKEISDFSETVQPKVMLSLQRLALNRYVSFHLENGKIIFKQTDKSEALAKDLDQAMDDLNSICLHEVDESSKLAYMNLMHEISENCKQFLK